MVHKWSQKVIFDPFEHNWTGLDHSGPIQTQLAIMANISSVRRGSEGGYTPFGTPLGPIWALPDHMDHHGPYPIRAMGHLGTIPDLFKQSQTIQFREFRIGIHGISDG